MKGFILKAVKSAIFASIVGSSVVFVGIIVTMIPHHLQQLAWLMKGALAYYLFAVVCSILMLFVFTPIYWLLRQLKWNSYALVTAFGVFQVFLIFRFQIPISEIYFPIAGGIVFALFHHQLMTVNKRQHRSLI
ncbi:hypothetical protein WAX88_19885 [Photobacterium damselae subsp. damselae]|uniref:Uncharacterized protein n=1 Tax=Photobacterium damselae subsp. damselae TaxID=85581 RepID=A0A7Y7Q9E8_PHODD|nr:hypothetical protein [Photobacterium damselae]EHA1080414.1 hypothetical protein [Photobacterium damselae]NVO60881.1 hypothetical protein [Photobacterium damselae subsp. damselae]NVP01780.1 hypothetical protein [Photobacterium damselae subsp. damselae]OEC83808.1 hypothetical protein A9D46_08845 [Photobacterium damselae subsp. damselae]PSB86870.1 hypothetical protein C5F64_10270 [Photobacterium damselae subsp. damselae]